MSTQAANAEPAPKNPLIAKCTWLDESATVGIGFVICIEMHQHPVFRPLQ